MVKLRVAPGDLLHSSHILLYPLCVITTQFPLPRKQPGGSLPLEAQCSNLNFQFNGTSAEFSGGGIPFLGTKAPGPAEPKVAL